MYDEVKEYYDIKDFLKALYRECLVDDRKEDIYIDYAHCEIWLNNKSIQLHICDGED